LKQVTTFEGWYDQEPNWEFDMPVYMAHPVFGYSESGNSGGVEELIEDYQIDYFMGKREFWNPNKEEAKHIKSTFTRAKNGRARSGIYYWKRVTEWDDEDENCHYTVIESVTTGKEN